MLVARLERARTEDGHEKGVAGRQLQHLLRRARCVLLRPLLRRPSRRIHRRGARSGHDERARRENH